MQNRVTPTLIHKQLIGAAGALVALIAVLMVHANLASWFAGVTLPSDDVAARLSFAARWLLLPGLALLAGVVVAARRGFMSDAIDGTRTPASHALEINLRYNQNTLEQTMLAAIAWGGLAVALPHEQLNVIPAMAMLFVIGRVAFWIGYLLHPMGRAFGMTLTVLPTLAAYAWLAGQMWNR